ncbi:hypothetical protein CASFOL_002215 [Castilleja foliolosa]|uniref:FBD domain-containing protein n=1 Tax=Castilleja foliolosa TaxID=1961234 RepID=A0ABD3EHL8_9LAMI
MGTRITKHQKLSDVSPNMSSIDRISALQDDLLCHILSFLPTKDSVATSVLSTRWRHLWAHVPNVDFDSEHHTKDRLSRGTNFCDIIYRVMLMYKVHNINNFRLSYKDACSEYQLETCIATAILRNVKNLYLDLGNQVQLPLRIFAYKTLVELKLHDCGFIPSASTSDLYLPALKILYLGSVEYESSKSLEHLIAGCPVLEELFIVRSSVDPLVCCYISSPTLNKLVLFTNFTNDGAFTLTYSVRIKTPALKYLEFQDTVSKDLSFGPLTFLVTANVQFHNYDEPSGGDFLYSRSVLKLFRRLCNVKNLVFCISLCNKVAYRYESSASILKFPNLTNLSFSGDWRLISIFLAAADNLEALTIETVNNNLTSYRFPDLVPTCLTSRLRMVKMDQFKCTKLEFIMTAYLLKNAKVLKKMDIISQQNGTHDFKAKFEALNHISSFRRGSDECQVVFR